MSSVASRVWMTTGSVALQRDADLRGEHFALHVARREIVVIVEPDLADAAAPVTVAAARVAAAASSMRPANAPARCG